MNIDQLIVQKGTLNDLLFRGKNKAYGAYFLRAVYPEHLKKSLVYFLAGICALSVGYVVYDNLKDKIKFNTDAPIRAKTVLTAPPPIDKDTPPPPPPPPPPPVKATIQFVPPKIVEVAAPDEEIKTVDEVIETKAAISTTTQAGQDIPEEVGLNEGTGAEPVKSNEPFTVVEQMPEFPGGEEALLKYLADKIKYPAYAQENEIEGTVLVNFIVNEDGTVTSAKVLKGIKGGCDEEALRVIRNMPRWKPGKQQGHAVRVFYDVPVNFQINDN